MESKTVKKPAVKKEKPITDAEMDQISKETGKTLAGQRLVQIYVPDYRGTGYFECSINGHNMRYKSGEIAELPESVVALIEHCTSQKRIAEERVKEFNGSGKNLGVV